MDMTTRKCHIIITSANRLLAILKDYRSKDRDDYKI